MPQGGSPQHSKGLKRKGPALIERVVNMPFRRPKNAKITPKRGFEPKFPPHGPKFSHARMALSALRRLRNTHTRCVPSQLILRMTQVRVQLNSVIVLFLFFFFPSPVDLASYPPRCAATSRVDLPPAPLTDSPRGGVWTPYNCSASGALATGGSGPP